MVPKKLVRLLMASSASDFFTLETRLSQNESIAVVKFFMIENCWFNWADCGVNIFKQAQV